MVTAKIKNSDINQESEKANAIRIAVPTDQTIPDYPQNLALYAYFEQVMFVFDNVLDKDVTSYEYQLYKSDQVTGSFPNYSLVSNPIIYLSGESGSNVFSVAVENSTDTTTIRYYGRVRTKDSSNNYSSWSPLVLSDQDTPLIGNQYVSSITAAKITAGTIGAHQIILSQAGPQTNIAAPANMAILRSSDYNGSYNSNTSTWTNGTSGWIVAGDGHAEFSSASIRGGLKAESVYINADNRWRRNNTDTAVSDEFKVGSSTKYLYFDGTNLNFTGDLSAAGGTFTGAISGGTIDIGGSDATSFHVDSAGNMWLGASTYAAAPFKVSSAGAFSATSGSISGSLISGGTISGTSIDINGGTFQVTSVGALTATSANITGTINATSGSFSGTVTSTSGTIAGWTLNSGSFSSSYITISNSGYPFIRLNTQSLPNGGLFDISVQPGTNIPIVELSRGAFYTFIAPGYVQAQDFVGNLSGNATTATTASNANALAGYPADFSENVNTVPIRQSDASIRAGYLVMTGGVGTAAGSEVRKRNDGYLLTFTSRKELKNNIENVDPEFALSIVNSLQPVSFRMNEPQYIGDLFSEREATYREYGFIAQDVAEIDANLATYSLNAEGDAIQPQAWSSHALISLSVSAIKGLVTEIEDLRNRISVLESDS